MKNMQNKATKQKITKLYARQSFGNYALHFFSFCNHTLFKFTSLLPNPVILQTKITLNYQTKPGQYLEQ